MHGHFIVHSWSSEFRAADSNAENNFYSIACLLSVVANVFSVVAYEHIRGVNLGSQDQLAVFTN